MNIQYDYTNLLEEFGSDCIEFGILPEHEIRIIRKIRKDTSYCPVIDYLLPGQEFLEDDLKEDNIILEFISANQFIKEMVEMTYL